MPQRRPFSAELKQSQTRAAPPPLAAPPAPESHLAAAVGEVVRRELPYALSEGLGEMVGAAIAQAVEQRLPEIVREVVAAQLPAVVHAVVEQATGTAPAPADGGEPASQGSEYMDLIHLELVELLDRIHHTRAEIASLRPASGDHDQIVTATAELESVVQATELATGDILEAAEHLQGVAEAMAAAADEDSVARGFADEIEMQATKILTTCSFQDLTGQRITAAVNTLLYVEQSLTRVVELWGISGGTGDSNIMRNRPDDDRPDRHLLNGPQAEGQGVSQEDIDALFG
jgi:chemotaxis regulatin CheY-phosphate phosphatase CheZ